MLNKTTLAIVLLDIILIMMTATWTLASLYQGMSNIDLWYNYVYVLLNITTLLLNLYQLNQIPQLQ